MSTWPLIPPIRLSAHESRPGTLHDSDPSSIFRAMMRERIVGRMGRSGVVFAVAMVIASSGCSSVRQSSSGPIGETPPPAAAPASCPSCSSRSLPSPCGRKLSRREFSRRCEPSLGGDRRLRMAGYVTLTGATDGTPVAGAANVA
jgi:hypothetical protein